MSTTGHEYVYPKFFGKTKKMRWRLPATEVECDQMEKESEMFRPLDPRVLYGDIHKDWLPGAVKSEYGRQSNGQRVNRCDDMT